MIDLEYRKDIIRAAGISLRAIFDAKHGKKDCYGNDRITEEANGSISCNINSRLLGPIVWPEKLFTIHDKPQIQAAFVIARGAVPWQSSGLGVCSNTSADGSAAWIATSRSPSNGEAKRAQSAPEHALPRD